jgi:hypothetical protein
MSRQTVILEQAVEMAAKVGHLSRQSFKAMFTERRARIERLRWGKLKFTGCFSPSQFIDGFEYVTLTLHGLAFARAIGIQPAHPTNRQHVLHDEAAAQFAQWMQRNKFIKYWAPEIQLKQARSAETLLYTQGRQRKFPDVVMGLNVPGAAVQFAVEFELTQKSRRRYHNLLSAYSTLNGIDTVLFVTRNAAIASAIREVMAEMRFPESRMTVLFSTVDEVKIDPANALFRSNQRVWTIPAMVQTIMEQRTKCA